MLRIGTCSWKYDSWIGLIYSDKAKQNYLKEYSSFYSTVEIDQWFWSLFPGQAPKLPEKKVVAEYASAVPDNFKFSIKVPNSITLTHYYSNKKSNPLIENPHFLSQELFSDFLSILEPLGKKIGPIIFQFEYLNKQKMLFQKILLEKCEEFFKNCPAGYQYTIELRNPNYLNKSYFDFLNNNGLYHVFIHGYYMPPVFAIFEKYKDCINGLTVIRLHGPGRKEMEEKTHKVWNKIVEPRDNDLGKIFIMVNELLDKNALVYVNVNNHYEGSAPLTIEKIITMRNSNLSLDMFN